MAKRKSETAGQHRITIKDIAAMANVSIGTVDRVLHNRGEVNQETQDRVMSFVKELGYTPNLLAKSLARKKQFTIAVLIPGYTDNYPYWEKPLEGFKRAATELKDFNTKIELYHYDAGEQKSFIKELNRVISVQPDGLVMAPNFYEATLSLMPKCREKNIPCMFIDNNPDDREGLAFFGQDAFQSGKVAAKLMHYSLPAGSTVLILNIARNKAITRHMKLREEGFIRYFNDTVPEKKIETCSTVVDLTMDREPADTLNRLLSQQKTIAGIFVTNSKAHKVASCLAENGKDHRMLIGYDLVDANMEYLKKGIIDFLIGQKPEDQGYRSAMAMFNYLLTRKQTERVNYSPIDIITVENLDYYTHHNS